MKKHNFAYIFDFDDTLIKSKNKIHIYRDNKLINKLTPDEYHHYKKHPDETPDFCEYDTETKINATFGPLWKNFKHINDNSEYPIYILTARNIKSKKPIYNFLIENNIKKLPIENIYCTPSKGLPHQIPGYKLKVLKEIIKKDNIEKIIFFDDNDLTIKHVEKSKNIFGILVK